MTLPELLDTRRVVLCVGSGGVGRPRPPRRSPWPRRRGRHTVVLTVDPAQRLRDALAIGGWTGARAGCRCRAGRVWTPCSST
jgi:hypothetical protein